MVDQARECRGASLHEPGLADQHSNSSYEGGAWCVISVSAGTRQRHRSVVVDALDEPKLVFVRLDREAVGLAEHDLIPARLSHRELASKEAGQAAANAGVRGNRALPYALGNRDSMLISLCFALFDLVRKYLCIPQQELNLIGRANDVEELLRSRP